MRKNSPPPLPPPLPAHVVDVEWGEGKKEPAEAAEGLGEMRPDILGSVNVAGSRREASTFTVRFKAPLSDTRM